MTARAVRSPASLAITVTGGSGNTSTSQNSTITATVGSSLALVLTGNATFGAIVPGVSQDYTASIGATVTSSAASAKLTVGDPSSTATGHLVNGTYSLAQPLQVQATDAAHPTGVFAPVTGIDNPLTLLTYTSPTSSDAVTIAFKQSVGAAEVLRAGGYSKNLTFTVSTTTP